MLDQVINVIRSNSFDSIYLTGYLDYEDDEVAQFYSDMRFLYFEFGDKMVEFYKYEPVNQASKLRVTVVDSVRHEFDLEDVVPGKSKINGIIFKNPLADNRVEKMYCFNLKEKDGEFLCDALHIKLCNGQDIFLDPGFLGINIGGLDVKQVWEDNLMNGVVPEEIRIEFEEPFAGQ